MGQKAIYICNKCKNEFESSEGGGFFFAEYRCVKCDKTKVVEVDRTVPPDQYKPPGKSKIGKCKTCGGKLEEDLKPMCPRCKSRNVVEKTVLILYD